MKRRLAVLALGIPVWAFAAAPNAQDYTVPVHVTKSWIVDECGDRSCTPALHLDALIAGKKFQLEAERHHAALLKPGDYQARVLKTPRAVNFPNAPYDDFKVYEFVFPDGQTRKYTLVGEEE